MSNYKMNKAKAFDKEQIRRIEELEKGKKGVEKTLIKGKHLIINVEDEVKVSEEFMNNLKKKVSK